MSKLIDRFYLGRKDRNQQAINDARTHARECLMELVALESNVNHPAFLGKRKQYFDAVRKYADLTDQTFESAIVSMF